MGSGGGWNPEEDIKKMVDNPVDTFISGLINVAGASVRAIDETVGELTGRNIARKQAMVTQDAINEQRIQATRDRATQVQQQEARERQLSGMAKQKTGAAQGSTSSLGGVEQQMAVDFLGL